MQCGLILKYLNLFLCLRNIVVKKLHHRCLALSWRRSLSHRSQSIDLLRKSTDWFLYNRYLRPERVSRVLDKSLDLHFLFVLKTESKKDTNHDRFYSFYVSLLCDVPIYVDASCLNRKREKRKDENCVRNSFGSFGFDSFIIFWGNFGILKLHFWLKCISYGIKTLILVVIQGSNI